MKLNLNNLNKLLLHTFKDEAELLKNLSKLHSNFTSERGKISEYRESIALISAYTMFYLPTNIIKFKWMMYFLQHTINDVAKLENDMADCDFIDLGTGPATYVLAYLDYFSKFQTKNNKIYAIDCSDLMLKQANLCVQSLFPIFKEKVSFGKWKAHELQKIVSSERKKWLFVGHSLDEIGQESVLNYVEKINPKVITFLTPGTSSSFKELMIIGHELRRKRYTMIYPCHFSCLSPPNDHCPLLKQTQEERWCHQVIKGDFSEDVTRLSQLASIDRRYLPFIAHIYVCDSDYETNANANANTIDNKMRGRVVKFIGESKADIQLDVCILKEQKQLVRVQILKRDIRDNLKRVRSILLGDTLTFEIKKVISNDFYRIGVFL
ncbi:MAG: hypothetical protein HQK51_09565 [Oligoflexia bacterium]|nr:hypothetical protein [Oligoflexia bacterium]